jgi:acyl carrier protein
MANPGVDDIRIWIVSYLSQLFDLPEDEIELNVPLERYGMDSTAAAGLTGDLGDWLGLEIDPQIVLDYPSIDGLSAYLAEKSSVPA